VPWDKRAATVEEQIRMDIIKALGSGFDPKFFIPYVQLHEFEALAFADISVMVSVLAPIASRSSERPEDRLIRGLEDHFSEILKQAGSPEAINDGFETCPSRRIGQVVPAYKKRAQGPIVTDRIGIDVLRNRCGHFGDWLDRLERVGQANP
jgi:hypothetical protein